MRPLPMPIYLGELDRDSKRTRKDRRSWWPRAIQGAADATTRGQPSEIRHGMELQSAFRRTRRISPELAARRWRGDAEATPRPVWNQTQGTVSSASVIFQRGVDDTSVSNGLLASTGGVSLYFRRAKLATDHGELPG